MFKKKPKKPEAKKAPSSSDAKKAGSERELSDKDLERVSGGMASEFHVKRSTGGKF